MLKIRPRLYWLILLSLIVFSAYPKHFSKTVALYNDFEGRLGFSVPNESFISAYEQLVLVVANEVLELDKKIFFNVYTNSFYPDSLINNNAAIQVELRSAQGDLVKTQKHRLINGNLHAYMSLPDDLANGHYQLIAFTPQPNNNTVQNRVFKSIWLGNINESVMGHGKDAQLSISVEGGNFLAETKNRLIIHIPDSILNNTKSLPYITDNEGEETSKIKLFSNNLGTAILTPETDKTYFIKLSNGVIYPLPKPKAEGYLLHANNLDDEDIIIKVSKASNTSDKTIKLIAQSAGDIIYAEKDLNFKMDNTLEFVLPKKDMPSGLIELKLIDATGAELNNRPVWIDNTKMNVEFIPIDKGTDSSTFRIRVTNTLGKPVNSNVSLSINKFNLNSLQQLEASKAHKLEFLDGLYVDETKNQLRERSRDFIQDLTVQSSNVKEENVFETFSKAVDKNLYIGENGLVLRGTAYDIDDNILNKTRIQVMAKSESEILIRETVTDSNGYFELSDLQLTGDARFIFRKKAEAESEKLVKFIPKDDYQSEQLKAIANKEKDDKILDKEQQIANKVPNDQSDVEYKDVVELDEVEVKTKSVNITKSKSIYGIDVPFSKISVQDYDRPKSLARMLNEIPGVTAIQNNIFGGYVSINRANGPILWVLDGFTLPKGNNSLQDMITMVAPKDIERIEVLIGSNAAMYGTRAAGGVIRIYTRSGLEDDFDSKKENQIHFRGYEPSLNFDEYWDKLSKKSKEESNLIYWNPNLKLDEKGEAIIRLSNIKDSSKLKLSCTMVANGEIHTIVTSILY